MNRSSLSLGWIGVAFLGCLAPHVALAQDEASSGDGGNVTTVSMVLLREGDATPAQATVVSIGLRRGLREVEGIRFVHPVDSPTLTTVEFSQDVQDAIDELEPIADMVRTGDANYAYNRADELLALFEQNLERVHRAQLVDAYMLSAVGRCRAGRRRECEQRMREVFAFREGLEYDEARYGPDARDVFDRMRLRATSGGRGSLLVETEPEGAEVYVDGRSYGPSPIRADGLLEGAHFVTIKEVGFAERIIRTEVRASRETSERYTLEENPRARLIVAPETQDRLRGELGEPRAGPTLQSVGNGTLGTTQLIAGVIRPAAAGQVHVQLYLYHMHTRLLQAQAEATLTTDEAGMEQARALAVQLYRGVDLSGGIEAPEDDTHIVGPQPELYEQWWFWAIVAGGVAAVAVGIGLGVALGGEQAVPSGFNRLSWDLP